MSTDTLVKAAVGVGASYGLWKLIDSKLHISYDIGLLRRAGPALKENERLMLEEGMSVVTLWERTMSKPGIRKKVAFIDADTDTSFTFGQIDEMSNQVGHWARQVAGYKPGDHIALLAENRPQYVAVWLGLSKAGMVAALINNNTKGGPLIHAFAVAGCVGAIFGAECTAEMADVAEGLREKGVRNMAVFGSTEKPSFAEMSLDEGIAGMPKTMPPKELRSNVKITSPCCFIYTSGTTGLPKACVVSHMKLMNISLLGAIFQIGFNDVIYGSGMPLYHSAANIGVMQVIRQGCTMIIRKKFSARNHWTDCVKHKATAMQYIGELCRYLLASPNTPAEKKHRVRVAVGNGLRPEIWDQFQRRFHIPEIGEFYGATEGNGATFNHCVNYQGQGAVGRTGYLGNLVRPLEIVKFDVENEVPVRDKDSGFCIRCATDEPGELVVPIRSIKVAGGEADDFEGYTNSAATESKLLRNVFKKGDRYFRSGDLLRRDSQGYFYFVDRIGDTFRWKGENVSTMEVSEVLSAFDGVVDANVYGVEIPGKDGRACMVAMTVSKDLDPEQLAKHCRKSLPSYSIPLFIRFLPQNVDLTGTFKHKKVEYRKEGCDPAKVTDKMWWYNVGKQVFEPFGAREMDVIRGGKAKL